MNEKLLIVLPLLIGFVLDSLLGDPRRLPHPVRLFGKLISSGESRLNSGENRRLKGATMAVLLISGVYFSLLALLKISQQVSEYLFLVLASAGVFYGLANRSLIGEAWLVMKKLKTEGLEAGRKQLRFIVGRETSQLNEQQIRTAVLETLAENLSDGVVAPLFFYALGGVPAMLAYKMANTLDSMVGYKSDRYRDFGWFSARLDDVLNYVPSRITALLMALVSLSPRSIRFILKYGRQHSSPNSGYPEAALAGILNCRFGGPNVYHGMRVEKPYIGHLPKELTDRDFLMAASLNAVVCVVTIFMIVGIALIYY
jgi:adenosylcobinamide-phosphate synthase